MKAIKLDSDMLQKTEQYLENENLSSNIKQFKKKHSNSKNKAYDPDSSKIETKNNLLNRKNSQEGEVLASQIKQAIQKSTTNDQQNKQSKSSIRLPIINARKSKKTSVQYKEIMGTLQGEQNNDFIKQNRASKNKRPTIADNVEEEDKVSSFLKYIQIKPMKPTQKNITQKNDMSVRDLKITRQQKSIPLKLNKTNTRQDSPSNADKKTSLTQLRMKKDQQKSEKAITSYTIRKQKRSLSINQNSQPVRKKKQMTNSYYDYCNFVCILNKVQRPSTPIATYKAYVAKGNNSILVKNSLKSRFWWNIVDNQSQVNLYWSQMRDQKFVDTLKCYDGNRQNQHSQKITAEFIIPKQNKQLQKGTQQIRQFTGNGFNKFLSDQERKQYSKNQYLVQFQNVILSADIGNPNKNKTHNHLQYHWHISNKKALYYNLKNYYTTMKQDPFQFIPLTFHIQKFGDNEWQRFVEAYNERKEDLKKKKEMQEPKDQKVGKKKKEKNLWIVKPGENSNQGNGIQVFDNIQEIAEMVKTSGERPNGRQRSYIIQRYLMPFLYNKRKFDIRCYVLVTSIKGVYKAYWYEEGYIRTSSKQFTLKNLKNRFIHLTNDAVQKKSEDYGKFQNGNKVSFSDFQKYLTNTYPEKDYKFFKTVYPAMIKRAADAIKSTCMVMDAKKRQYSFEIFGLDFMIDQDFATWLIEVNTNPCLQLSSPLLARIIPNMVQNALKIAVDPLFPPPKDIPKTKSLPIDIFEINKFALIFNSSEDQQILTNLAKDTNLSNIVESDEQDENHDDVE